MPDPHAEHIPHHYGSRLCLALANSVIWRRGPDRRDLLHHYGHVVEYLEENLLFLPAEQARSLYARAAERPDDAAAAFARAVELREALFRLFSAVAAREAPAAGDLALLNRWIGQAGAHEEVVPDGDGFMQIYRDAGTDLLAPLWPVARSAARVLTSASDLERLKQCPSSQCGWLFIDESRNRTRRWCDPALCGNRARVRSHYARTRAQRSL
jgi:predicted RNA-binding Zn ribbon-like protein